MDLVDWEIREHVRKGIIGIDPFNLVNIQPNSYDVTLSDEFIVYSNPRNEIVDPKDKSSMDNLNKRKFVGDEIIIYPHEFVLGSTREYITLPSNVKAQLDGKSSLARLGVEIHQNGGYIDSGFAGNITLEIITKFPTKLYSGMAIGQLCFTRTSVCSEPYNVKKGSKYNGQTGPTESMYYKNF